MLEDQPFHNQQSSFDLDFSSFQIHSKPSNGKQPSDQSESSNPSSNGKRPSDQSESSNPSSNGKRPSDQSEPSNPPKRSKLSPQHPNTPDIQDSNSSISSPNPPPISISPPNSPPISISPPNHDSSALINPIGRDLSISCLLRLSRSDYTSISALNQTFRTLIRSGELYRLRRQAGIAEHWVYFSCNMPEWNAYDPYRSRWLTLPKLPPDDCFKFSDKESLAVGTELLVFGKGLPNLIVLKYSILTNNWTPGVVMNQPRCLFGSASLSEIAIIAGGTDLSGNILNSAELYNSETNTWTTLPPMNKPRKKCSGIFMDGKFYVIGGMASNTEVLTCGEEFDPRSETWKVIPNMSLGLNGASGAPPLVAVVKNQLYAADYEQKEVRKYKKDNNEWQVLGNLPERSASMNGWGLAFRGCGERLIVIGGPRVVGGGGVIELNEWRVGEGERERERERPEWRVVARKVSGSFVYNCAIMGC